MNTLNITQQVQEQLLSLNPNFDFEGHDQDTLNFYSDFLSGINKINPIKGFKIGIDTGENDSNFTIITFKEHLKTGKQFYATMNIIDQYGDGLADHTSLDNHLIISFEH